MSDALSGVTTEAFSTPSTNNFALPPPMVAATWIHWPVAGCVVLQAYSTPSLRMRKRIVLLADRVVRKKYSSVPLPKSKTRCHMLVPSQLNQVAMVISSESATPAGSFTTSSVPSRSMAEERMPVT